MEKKNLKLRIGYIYPKQMNTSGDGGNILTLIKRSEWRNIDVECLEIDLGQNIPECDIYYLGGEQDKEQIAIAPVLNMQKDFLLSQRDKGAVFLGLCGGFQLFGNYIQNSDNSKIPGLNLFDAYTVSNSKRYTGNVTAKVDFLSPGTLVGFENHSGLTYLQGDTKPLAIVEIGSGNNGEDKTEGARFMNVFGSYLHGSLLPSNPHFADYLISLALEKRYGEKIELFKLDDKLEFNTHHSLVSKSYK